MTMHDNNQLADTKSHLAVKKISLLKRFLITSLVVLLVTASLLIFLYWQDQVAEHKKIAAVESERSLTYLQYVLDHQFDAHITNGEVVISPLVPLTKSNIDSLFTSALGALHQYDVLNLKIYNLSGVVIYSTSESEIGGASKHPDYLARALRGETVHLIESRDVFMSRRGELHDADVALTYMPLTYAGKQAGVIEIYIDASHIFERLQSNIIQIALIVFGAFAMLYAALFFAVLRTDRTVTKWQKIIVESEASLRLAQESGGIFSWEYDLVNNKQKWSENSISMLGFPALSAPTWEDFLALVHSDDRQRVIDAVQSHIDQGTKYEVEFRVIVSNGNIRWIRSAGQVERDPDGKPILMRGIGQDVTERKLSAIALQKSERHLKEAQSIAHMGSWTNDMAGQITWSDELYRIYGVSPDFTLNAEAFFNLIHPDDRPAMQAWIDACVSEQKPGWLEFRCIRPDGTIRYIYGHGELVFDADGKPSHMAGTAQDITERKLVESELRIASSAFESQDSLMITDADGVILRVNQAFIETTGYTAEEAVGQTLSLLKSGRHNADFFREMWETLQRTGKYQGEVWDRRKNGEIYPKWLTISGIKGDNGVVTHYVGAHHDITKRKQAEEQIHALAFYDALTKLPNRRLLNDRPEQTMASSKRSGRYGAAMFLDLDNFKPLNDTHGHSVGDLLLVEVARRIARCMREVDTIARFGGDEFVVVLSELDEDKAESASQASIVAEKIRATLDEPYVLTIQQDGKAETITVEHHCTSSIGVVLFINHEASTEDILKCADIAMYQAKEAGRNQIWFYEPKA